MEILNKKANGLGYTLIELIIVLALMCIVLSIAIPSISLMFNTSEKKELLEFKRDINFARNSAVMENKTYTLSINVPKNGYRIIREKNELLVVKSKEFTNGIVLKLDNLDHFITFYPTGTPNKAGTIRLTNRKKQDIRMTITPATGKVNIKIDGR